MKVFCPTCLATRALGRFVPLRSLFFEKRIPQISKGFSASSDGSPLFYCLCPVRCRHLHLLLLRDPLHPLLSIPEQQLQVWDSSSSHLGGNVRGKCYARGRGGCSDTLAFPNVWHG